MNKKAYILFIVLALTALTLISFDFVCGHMHESPFKPSECPLCTAFQSTELGHLVLIALLIFFLAPVIGIFSYGGWSAPIPIFITTFSLRAPPSCLSVFSR